MKIYEFSQSGDFGKNLVDLIDVAKTLPSDDPKKQFIQRLASTLYDLDETNLAEVTSNTKKTSTKSTTSNLALIDRANEAYWNKKLDLLRTMDPDMAAMFESMVKQAEETFGSASQSQEVKLAKAAAIKGIQLNTRGDIVKMDAELETIARDMASKLGLETKWARNLIGMFDIKISKQDRNKFIKACSAGTALDIPAMMRAKKGKLDDFITTNPPSVKEVYQSIKGTLLDISLSRGQRDATGPFEAMMAIMGGARKAEEGDLDIDGRKYEVKSSSISLSLGPNNTVKSGASGAWMESNPIKGPDVKLLLVDLLKDYKVSTTDALKTADFRISGIESLKNTLEPAGRKAYNIIYDLHKKIYPATEQRQQEWFKTCIKNMVDAILKDTENATAVCTRNQTPMAMLEYMYAKNNDGFIFYNSSVQEFLIINSDKEVMGLVKDSESKNIFFEPSRSMSMKGDKGSPGVYFGPWPSSPEGKKYKEQQTATDEWKKKLEQGSKINQQEKQDHGLAKAPKVVKSAAIAKTAQPQVDRLTR